MANWVTHLAIADRVLEQLPALNQRGFCVGSIAPDCNVENEDWSAFTPPREVTHWMRGEKKMPADHKAFLQAYVLDRRKDIQSSEELSFLLGYDAHLIVDAAFQWYIRDEQRVRNVWVRIHADAALRKQAAGYPENWDSVKQLFRPRFKRELSALEAEYLQIHPDSGYLTEILPLKEFPDYIDYLPPGCIVRKIGVMGYRPQPDMSLRSPVCISREELAFFIEDTAQLVLSEIKSIQLL